MQAIRKALHHGDSTPSEKGQSTPTADAGHMPGQLHTDISTGRVTQEAQQRGGDMSAVPQSPTTMQHQDRRQSIKGEMSREKPQQQEKHHFTDIATGHVHTHRNIPEEELPSSPLHKHGSVGQQHQRSSSRSSMLPEHKHIEHRKVTHTNLEDSDALEKQVHHLAEAVSHTFHRHDLEEVSRRREVERHQYHVQVVHAPLLDTQHLPEVRHEHTEAPTTIVEKHASREGDADLLTEIATGHGQLYRSTERRVAPEHTIIDKGEVQHVKLIQHLHTVIVPLIEKHTHEHHRTQTTYPIREVVHEAPVIHQATKLAPITIDEYVQRGGVLGSPTKHILETKVLPAGQCERSVEGLAEEIIDKLHLSRHRPTSPMPHSGVAATGTGTGMSTGTGPGMTPSNTNANVNVNASPTSAPPTVAQQEHEQQQQQQQGMQMPQAQPYNGPAPVRPASIT